MSDGRRWALAASRGRDGALYRWTSTSRMDDDALTRELHSWAVWGDVAAAQAPMVLRIVEIGQRRKGHQHTAWCRTFRHPAVMGRYAFQQRDGRPLQGSWKPIWYQDGDNDPKIWVDLMERDRVKLIHEVRVKAPTNAQCEDFQKQVALESARMEVLPKDWKEIPMFRPACDLPYVCPHQALCYR